MNEHAQTQVKENNESKRKTHRYIREHWVISGKLELKTPAHFGTGEQGDLTDMPLIMDEVEVRRPLLLGTSIAGALRNYLRERERGDGVPFPVKLPDDTKEQYKNKQDAERKLASTLLFGGYRGDDEGIQSPLIVHDALGHASDFELRDGVAIDAKTRTAADEKKFDIELLAAGSTFDLHFELLIGEPQERKGLGAESNRDYVQHRKGLLQALATTLHGLENGHITLGARKRRGYGECTAHSWVVQRYDLTTADGLLAWLASEREDEKWKKWQTPTQKVEGETSILSALQKIEPRISLHQDRRERATLTATFALDGSLLIRSGFGESDTGPVTVHLHSWRVDAKKPVPILPGTSWAGVLRHRASQIVRTLGSDDEKAQGFIDGIFGQSKIERDGHTWASRLSVKEKEIRNSHSLVQTRVKIDRFTGGAFESALFSEEPLFAKENTYVELELTLRPPYPRDQAQEEAEVGLLLLLLKDLWTGDLAVGGESGVGRGRLIGKEATLNFRGKRWTINRAREDGLSFDGSGNPTELEDFVGEFNKKMGKP